MLKRMILLAAFFLSFACVRAGAGEKAFSWTNAPGKGDNIAVNLNPYSLGKYLAQCQVNRPEIVNEVKTLLGNGEYYRKRTRDQKGTATLLTVYVDAEYTIHIITYRTEECPSCKGTGTRPTPLGDKLTIMTASLRCLQCEGKKKIPNHTTEKYYILSSEDFENPEEGRRIMSQRAYSGAPEGAEQWVERLVSKNPRERLAACVWLDQNYVRTGGFFQEIMPMLKKARYYDSNEKKKVMVWQFWAGKDMPSENKRAYYRIYADTKTGKITQKGFYAGK